METLRLDLLARLPRLIGECQARLIDLDPPRRPPDMAGPAEASCAGREAIGTRRPARPGQSAVPCFTAQKRESRWAPQGHTPRPLFPCKLRAKPEPTVVAGALK